MPLIDIYRIIALLPTVWLVHLIERPLCYWLILPLYFASCFCILALHFIVAFIWSLCIKKAPIPEKPKRVFTYITVETIDIVDRLAGVKTVGFDRAVLPEGPCLVVSNHISNFDPMVTAVYLRKKTSCFISKKGNFGIPIAGPFINKAGYICIDREDPQKAMEAIRLAVKRLRDGMWVGVYPEGTRSKTGELLPFSDGIFMIAKKAEVPVLVLTVEGTNAIRKNFLRKRTPVTLTFAGLIDAETVSECRTGELSQMARTMMQKKIS